MAPTWPSVRGEPQIQEHLDIAVNDLEASVRWAVEVGATLAGTNRRTTYGSCSTRRVPFLPLPPRLGLQRQQSAGGACGAQPGLSLSALVGWNS